MPKAQLSEEAIPEVHQYSMLQRFRGGKDLNAVAPFAPQAQPVQLDDEENNDRSNF